MIAAKTRPSIVLVESYNEITEGSHLMPSWPVSHSPGDGHWSGTPDDEHCAAQPCHPVNFTDTWGPENPWHYLDLTQRKIREWREGPPPAGADIIRPHALILAPRTDEVVSGPTPLRIVAADDRALREVRVYLDGFLLADGIHVLAVTVVDQAGNTDTLTSTFITRNAVASSDRERTPVIDTRR